MRFYVTTALTPFVILGLGLPPAIAQDNGQDLPLRDSLALPVEAEPTASTLDRSHGEEWHRVALRLSGSMCPACLLELQSKLRKQPGVSYAKINYKANGEQSVGSAHGHKTAATVIIYDRHATQWSTLQHFIASSYFHCVGVQDEVIDREKAE